MNQELGERANNFHLYSAHVNNLAATSYSLDRPDEAIDLFEKAIECRKTAQDYNDPNDRNDDVLTGERGLNKAIEMCAHMILPTDH